MRLEPGRLLSVLLLSINSSISRSQTNHLQQEAQLPLSNRTSAMQCISSLLRLGTGKSYGVGDGTVGNSVAEFQ